MIKRIHRHQTARILAESEFDNGIPFSSSKNGTIVSLSRNIYKNLGSIRKCKTLIDKVEDETPYDYFINEMSKLFEYKVDSHCENVFCTSLEKEQERLALQASPMYKDDCSPPVWNGETITCKEFLKRLGSDIIAVDEYLGKLGLEETYPITRDYHDSKFMTIKPQPEDI